MCVLVSFFYIFLFSFFFSNNMPTTEIYTLSLHDALPIYQNPSTRCYQGITTKDKKVATRRLQHMSLLIHKECIICTDRKSTRLNSSHRCISYAVFCLKKKNKSDKQIRHSNS